MQAKVQLHVTTHGGDIQAQDVLIEQDSDDLPHPRLSFATSFLQHIISDHYPSLHVGDQFKENTLNFTFLIQHVHITLTTDHSGEKRVIVTGMLMD